MSKVITSALKRVDTAVRVVVTEAQRGTYVSGDRIYDASFGTEGAVGIAPCHFACSVPLAIPDRDDDADEDADEDDDPVPTVGNALFGVNSVVTASDLSPALVGDFNSLV